MKVNTIKNLEEYKKELIGDINQRITDKILEQANADLLIKLINNADSQTEATNIAALGTTYKRTGFHFDKRLEKISNDIKYKVKNKALSFENDATRPTHQLIIGDNYDALQNLLITHKKKVDVIYIDPPYGKDNMGNFAETNYDNSITRDNLLSMLYPRLQLAKMLLSDEGVIFCSIDDKNHAYVKCLFDEVFGEMNFVGTYDWKKTATPPSLSKTIRKKFEYILCYKKGMLSALCGGFVEGGDMPLLNDGNAVAECKFKKEAIEAKIGDGVYKKGTYDRVELLSDFIIKNSIPVTDLCIKGPFKWQQSTIDEEIVNGTRFYIKTKKFAIRYARKGERIKTPSNVISQEECKVGTNEDGAKDLLSILSCKNFDFPKPPSLVKYLCKMVTYDKLDAVILDFFAGSGTTGQAVMELNREDEGNRTFILCQSNEITEKTPHGIAYDVTAKRMKRVMSGECYDGTKKFLWIEKHKPYNDNLNVYEIGKVSKTESTKKRTAFDKIDETCYGLKKFNNPTDKIAWVCENFENATKFIEEK